MDFRGEVNRQAAERNSQFDSRLRIIESDESLVKNQSMELPPPMDDRQRPNSLNLDVFRNDPVVPMEARQGRQKKTTIKRTQRGGIAVTILGGT